jgi:hypothetical protein
MTPQIPAIPCQVSYNYLELLDVVIPLHLQSSTLVANASPKFQMFVYSPLLP